MSSDGCGRGGDAALSGKPEAEESAHALKPLKEGDLNGGEARGAEVCRCHPPFPRQEFLSWSLLHSDDVIYRRVAVASD